MTARALPALAFIATLLAMALPSAAQYSEVVKGACKNDYKRFCSVYALDDPGLRKCMDKAGPSLSRGCVVALVNSGEVSYQRATQAGGTNSRKLNNGTRKLGSVSIDGRLLVNHADATCPIHMGLERDQRVA